MPLRFVLRSLRVRPGQQLNSAHSANQVLAVLRVFLRASASPRQIASLVLLALPLSALAQQQMPHAGYAYPAGGRQGATFEITVGGQFLDGVKSAVVSGPGVQATIVDHFKPLTPAQATQLRDHAKELSEKPNPTAEDRQKIAEIRAKLMAFVRRPTTPAIAETVRVHIALAADAPLGERELRLVTPNGLTNPVTFSVGQLPEVGRPPAKGNGQLPGAQAGRGRGQASPAPEPPMEIALPVLVNGQIMPGGIDRFRFQATKGQHIVAAAMARELLPYISDAVPGWFQATLGLTDSQGREVQYADHFLFHPDPVLYYEIPEDGAYTLEIHDSIYRGREDFVYRIELGELPFVTGIFPLGGRIGGRTAVELKGWNLPAGKLTEDTKGKPAGVYPISARHGPFVSNRVPFAVDALPEMLEKEPNNRQENAQRVRLPVIVNGRIDRPGDWDVFRFDGRAGEEIVAEVSARRLNSPLDSLLRLTDASGRELAVNDDAEDKGAALLTHQADSRINFKLPANGAYYLHLGDAQGKGGADYAYRLRISRPRPDFELRVVPSGINARAGATVPVTVYALRRDGFAGDIALKLKDAPAEFQLSGGVIPGNAESVRLTLTMPPRPEGPRSLALEGRATIAGREVRRAGVPAEDMMQAFYYHHLVPAKDWLAEVTGAPRPNARAAFKIEAESAIKVPRGGAVPVRVVLNAPRLADALRLELNQPPEGIAIQDVETVRDGVAIVLSADAAKVKAGLKGNLIVDAYMERPPNPDAKQPTARRRVSLGTLPAIPFEIVENVVARR
ncbi:MAG: hypothetical protein ABSC05_30690 [Candidatus Solibacter sp.]|jgi:hypothetical protein